MTEYIISEQVRELGKLQLDFSKQTIFPPEIQKMMGSPELFVSPEVLEFTIKSSALARILHENPANDAMLRIVYCDDKSMPVTMGLDRWLSHSLSGQALRDRLAFCSKWIANNFLKPDAKIFDLGSGSASYFFEALRHVKHIPEGFKWICRDIDEVCIDIGCKRAVLHRTQHAILFEKKNFMSSKHFPKPEDKGDFAVLIGVLCGMDNETAIRCLTSCREHLKEGGEILAATLLLSAFHEDPLIFRVLCNVGGWQLRPKKPETVESIFKEAGFTVKSVMTERPSGSGQYAIVHAKC